MVNESSWIHIIIRIILSMFFGASIGLERGQKRRAAGMRTHALVCLGSVIVMLTNQYINQLYRTGDPARLGAQVISGIGFLGVGTIIIDRRQRVRGLTTAASLWTCAGIGLALGSGFYWGAITGFICILFINIILNRVESFLMQISKYIEIYVTVTDRQALLQFKSMLEADKSYVIIHFNSIIPDDRLGKNDKRMAANIRIKFPKRGLQSAVYEKIKGFDGLLTLEDR